jgi:hypothetical protein
MPQLKPGARLRSAACSTEVMVVMAPGAEVDVTCGAAMLPLGTPAPTPAPALASGASGGTLIGKRYVNADGSLELLCTKPGQGSLAVDGAALSIKGAKPLPSSD